MHDPQQLAPHRPVPSSLIIGPKIESPVIAREQHGPKPLSDPSIRLKPHRGLYVPVEIVSVEEMVEESLHGAPEVRKGHKDQPTRPDEIEMAPEDIRIVREVLDETKGGHQVVSLPGQRAEVPSAQRADRHRLGP